MNIKVVKRFAPAFVQKAWDDHRKEASYRRMSALQPSDYESALKKWYRHRTGLELYLDDPRTFDEKMQWLKLYDSTPEKGRLSDKYLVRDWVAQRAGEGCLVPLLGVWDSPEQIDFDALPDRFVLKATHGCGWNIVVEDKAALDRSETVRRLGAWLETDYAFVDGLELQYRFCEPRIIAEAYMENTPGDLHDYKFFCFDGKVACIGFVRGRLSVSEEACFDRDWNKLPCTYYTHPRIAGDVPRPAMLDEAVSLAETRAEGFAHVRVDLYLPADGTVRFGEMTFTTLSGVSLWKPASYNDYFGSLIDLESLPAWKEMHGS